MNEEEVGTKNKNILVPSNNDTGYLVGMPPTFSVNTEFSHQKEGLGYTDSLEPYFVLLSENGLAPFKMKSVTTCDSVSSSLTWAVWKVHVPWKTHFLVMSSNQKHFFLMNAQEAWQGFLLPLGVSIHRYCRGIGEDAGS